MSEIKAGNSLRANYEAVVGQLLQAGGWNTENFGAHAKPLADVIRFAATDGTSTTEVQAAREIAEQAHKVITDVYHPDSPGSEANITPAMELRFHLAQALKSGVEGQHNKEMISGMLGKGRSAEIAVILDDASARGSFTDTIVLLGEAGRSGVATELDNHNLSRFAERLAYGDGVYPFDSAARQALSGAAACLGVKAKAEFIEKYSWAG